MSKNKKYEQLAEDIINLVGGKENIKFFTHCITRLRFVVKDRGLVDIDRLNKLDIAGCQWAGDQLQVIVGTSVGSVYDIICEKTGMEKKDRIDDDFENKNKEKLSIKKIPGMIVTAFSECMTPLVPYIIVIGMFSAIYAVIGPSGLSLVAEDSDVYQLCYSVAQAGFYFLPMAVAYSGSKRFGANPMLALMLAALMLYPNFIELVQGGDFTAFGIPVTAATYSGQVVPMILATWIMSYIERGLKKYMPEFLKTVLLGTLVILIMLPITLCVLAPFGYLLGEGLSSVLLSLYEIAGPLATAIIGAVWLLIIIPGMHSTLGTVALMTLISEGSEYIVLPVIFAMCFIAAAANLGVIVKTKDRKERELSIAGLVPILLGGVVEPSLYGIYIKRKKVFLSIAVGHAVTGLIMGILHVGVFAFSSSNFLAFMGYLAGGTSNMISAAIAIVAGCITTFALVLILGVESKKSE